MDCFIIHVKVRGFGKGHGSNLRCLKECPLRHFLRFHAVVNLPWPRTWLLCMRKPRLTDFSEMADGN